VKIQQKFKKMDNPKEHVALQEEQKLDANSIPKQSVHERESPYEDGLNSEGWQYPSSANDWP
jgi:hypothetical protein